MKITAFLRPAMLLLVVGMPAHAADGTGKSYYQPRLPWPELAQTLASGAEWTMDGVGDGHFSFGTAVQYQASTSDNNFAKYFLPNGKNDLVIKGANVAGDFDVSGTWLQIVGENTAAVPPSLARLFDVGSPDDAAQWMNNYQSTISMKPHFERSNALLAMRYRNTIGHMPVFFTVSLPVAQMRTDMRLRETGIEHARATRDSVPVLIAKSDLSAPPLDTDVALRQFMQSQYSLSAIEALSNPNKRYGKISNRVLDATGIGDMGIELSAQPCSFLTLGVRGELPTAKKGSAEYLFEPVLGSNGHGTVAAYATLHKELYASEQLALALRGHAQYQAQLPGNELRTFDLKEAGPWSRYLLLLDFPNDSHNGQSGVNFLTRSARVSTLQHVSLGLGAELAHKAFSLSVGYSAHAREREKLTLRGALPEQLFIAGQLAPFNGLNFVPAEVFAGEKNVAVNQHIKIGQDNAGEPIASPLLALTASDLDIKAASMPHYFSHQLMATVGYSGRVHDQLLHVNLGGSYEMLRQGNSCNVYSLFGALTLKI